MRSLLTAGFVRLGRSRIFWAEMLVLVGEMLFMLIDQRFFGKREFPLDSFFLYSVKGLGIYIAVFADVFLGAEYRDNAVRNKLMGGHGRSKIYLSFWILCYVSGLIFFTTDILTACTLGLPIYGAPLMPLSQLLALLFLTVLMTGAFCSIYTMVVMLARGKFILALPSYLLMGLLSILVEAGNHAPKTSVAVQSVSDGVWTAGSILQTLYSFLWDFLPVAQSLQLKTGYVAHPLRLALYSAVIMLCTNLAGILLFQRKDIA